MVWGDFVERGWDWAIPGSFCLGPLCRGNRTCFRCIWMMVIKSKGVVASEHLTETTWVKLSGHGDVWKSWAGVQGDSTSICSLEAHWRLIWASLKMYNHYNPKNQFNLGCSSLLRGFRGTLFQSKPFHSFNCLQVHSPVTRGTLKIQWFIITGAPIQERHYLKWQEQNRKGHQGGVAHRLLCFSGHCEGQASLIDCDR